MNVLADLMGWGVETYVKLHVLPESVESSVRMHSVMRIKKPFNHGFNQGIFIIYKDLEFRSPETLFTYLGVL